MGQPSNSPYDPGKNRTCDLRFRKSGATDRESNAPSGVARNGPRRPAVPHKLSTTEPTSLLAELALLRAASCECFDPTTEAA